MILLFAYLLMSVWAASQAGRWMLPAANRDEAVLGMLVSIGACTGLSATALFFAARTFDGLGESAWAVDFGLLAVVAITAGRFAARSPKAPLATASSNDAPRWMMALVLAVTGAVIGLVCWQYSDLAGMHPHGGWDAVAVWNTRARFLALMQSDWGSLAATRDNPDYPLLVPLTIARLWSFLGEQPAWVPRLFSVGWGLGTVALLAAAVSVLRGRIQGALAGMALLGSFELVLRSAQQVADVTMAFFVLAACTTVCLYDRSEAPHRHRNMILFGALLGSAAWTKNEGMIVAALLGTTVGLRVLLSTPRGFHSAAAAAAGLFVVGSAPAWFKLMLAPSSGFTAGLDPSVTLAHLTDPSRHAVVAARFLQALPWVGGPVLWAAPLYALLLGVDLRGRIGPASGAAIVGLVLCVMAYFMAYVTTPAPLQWHLETSCERLLLHFWPSCLLFFFLAAGSPQDQLLGQDESLGQGNAQPEQ